MDDSQETLDPVTTLVNNSSYSRGPLDSPQKSLLWNEVKTLLKLTWPVSAAYLLQMSLGLASVFSLGHLGTNELAASALATMFCNVTGFSIGIGFASALDTLCSQAFTGSSDPKALGKHLQRAFLVMLLLSLPISGLWLFSEKVFLFLGQDPLISALAGDFTAYMILGLFPNFVNECLKRYLQAQGIMKANLYVTMLASPLNIFLQYLLVWSPYAIGAKGAPIATSLTYIFIPLLTIVYIRCIQGGEAWGGWEMTEIFDWKKLWGIVKLGVPGTLMICSEWWAFEIVALLAGLLGNKTLAAQTIVLNTSSLAYMLPLGISVASSTRIGNSLGGQLPFTAKMASRAALLVAFIIAGLNCAFLFGARHSWGYLWTSDSDVTVIVSQILPLAALFQFSDGLGAAGGGVLRGAGRQQTGAYINLAGYYLLGLPLGSLLAFQYHFGLPGLWIGLTTGLVTVSFVLLWIIYVMDWEEEARNAMALMRRTDDLSEDPQSIDGLLETGQGIGVLDNEMDKNLEEEALLRHAR